MQDNPSPHTEAQTASRPGCGRAAAVGLTLLWLAIVPAGAMLLIQLALDQGALPGVRAAVAIGLTALFLLPPLLLAASLSRRRPGWEVPAAIAAALAAVAGYILLDAVMRALPVDSANLASLLRLLALTAYALLTAWAAPRLAGAPRRDLRAWLGLDRFDGPTFLLGLALAALLAMPWPLVGALGDRFASLKILLRILADTLPAALLIWGLVFTLLTVTCARSEWAALVTVLVYGIAVAGRALPAADWGALATAAARLPLAFLLTELRARGKDTYPLLLPLLLILAAPALFTDPRDAPAPLLHVAAHIVVWFLLIVIALALFALRRLLTRWNRRDRVVPTWAGWIATAAAVLVLWATWGGLYVFAGAPGFADDGFLIIMEEQADLSQATDIGGRQERIAYVYDALVQTAERTQGPIHIELEELGLPYRPYYIINMVRVDGHRNRMAHFEQLPGVAQVILNPNRRAYPRSVPYPAYVMDSWGAPQTQTNLTTIRAGMAWELGVDGSGIVVAGQDTGVDWTHPALKPSYRGWDGLEAEHDTNWHDAWDDTVVPFDDDAHGTHTMGTVVGDDGTGNRVGVAPGAQWIACRNMRSGIGNPGSYAECFEFFLAPYSHGGDPFVDGDVGRAPHVVTNSWGCPPEEGCQADTLQPAVEALRAAGIMVVVGAGNDGPQCRTAGVPPALYDAAFTVGATYKDGDVVGGTTHDATDIVSFSSRGPVDGRIKPDVAAPGYDVRSSVPGGDYGRASGTSMATPHVAGLVALIWSADPALIGDIDATEQLICATARPVPVENACTPGSASSGACACGGVTGVPNNVFGCGTIDAGAAARAALDLP